MTTIVCNVLEPFFSSDCFQEVPGMGFHISQPGSTIATSLISAEAKSKHVLLLAIKVIIIYATVLYYQLTIN
jgi:hypothetical protein